MFSAIRTRLTPSSLSRRLTFWYLLTLGVSLAGFAVFAYAMRARTLYHEFDANLTLQARQMEVELRQSLLSLDIGPALDGDSRAQQSAMIVREVPDRVLFRSAAFPRIDWPSERQLAAASRVGTPLVTVRGRDDETVRVATVVVPRHGADSLAIQVAAFTAPVEQTLRGLVGFMSLAIVGVLAIAAVGSTWTSRRALAPVDEIVRRVRHIQASDLSQRLDVHAGSDEIDRLVTTVNEMLDRIETSMRAARRFAADASHELQTPVAAMRAAVDVALKGTRTTTQYHAMASDLLEEIDRLSALIRDLRLLALAEAGQLLARPEAVDLAALTADCCEIARAIAEEKEVRIDEASDHTIVVRGSALHLRRVLLNLADNAIRHSPAGSTVVISAGREDGQAVLSVRDTGCGIAGEDLPHIFDAFYRADPARARSTGGFGLGLAIADQVVRAHGGRIAVHSTLGVGSVFRVYLPLAA
jgi:two-component system, OmpR family, sensor kinase